MLLFLISLNELSKALSNNKILFLFFRKISKQSNYYHTLNNIAYTVVLG